MIDKPRKQLSLRFDNYADLLKEAQDYCKMNNITLTDLVANGIRLAMTSPKASQMPSQDLSNNNDIRLAKMEEQLAMTSHDKAIAFDPELIRDEIAERTAYLATAMNEMKSQLEDEIQFLKTSIKKLEINQEDKLTYPPVVTETTIQDVVLPPKATPRYVVLPQAGRPLSASEMKSKVNSIARTLADKGCEISRTIIRCKILEMYPKSEDWLSDDARKEIIRALEK